MFPYAYLIYVACINFVNCQEEIMNNNEKVFRTLKGYEMNSEALITKAMEDYLEMIYRIYLDEKYIRVNEIARRLNVKPSSSSKMVMELSLRGLIDYEKYGVIRFTEEGLTLGEYLLYRHNVINSLLCLINDSAEELKQTEEVEHYINKKTLINIEKLNDYLVKNKYGQEN